MFLWHLMVIERYYMIFTLIFQLYYYPSVSSILNTDRRRFSVVVVSQHPGLLMSVCTKWLQRNGSFLQQLHKTKVKKYITT